MRFSLVLILICTSISGHCQLITENDSFEGGFPQNAPPNGWNNLENSGTTTDTQPGRWGNQKAPSHGDSYISLITREINPPGSFETCWGSLVNPFKQHHCYSLSIDLALANEFRASDWSQTYWFDNPSKFKVIGFNGDYNETDEKEVLWESNEISHHDWMTYSFNVIPELNTYTKIALQPDFLDSTIWLNSAILIDNLKFQEDLSEEITVVHQNLEISNYLDSITWMYQDSLFVDSNFYQFPIQGNGLYTALFTNPDGCLSSASIDLSFDYDSVVIYPNPTSDFLNISLMNYFDDPIRIKLIDSRGRLIKNQLFDGKEAFNHIKVDVRSLSDAIYFLRVERKHMHSFTTRIQVLQ